MTKVLQLYAVITGLAFFGFSITAPHDYNQNSVAGHVCRSKTCSPNFPFQTCGSVCGPTALVTGATACLCRPYFDFLTEPGQNQTKRRPQSFLRHPTRYLKYIRRVIMSWFSLCDMKVENVVPTQFLGASSVHGIGDENSFQSDSDSNCDTPRVNPSHEDLKQSSDQPPDATSYDKAQSKKSQQADYTTNGGAQNRESRDDEINTSSLLDKIKDLPKNTDRNQQACAEESATAKTEVKASVKVEGN